MRRDAVAWGWMDGEWGVLSDLDVPCQDRGFLLGDGLFETLRICGGVPIEFDAHWERLRRSSVWAGISLPISRRKAYVVAEELARRSGCFHGILRVTLTRGDGGRGLLVNPGQKPRLLVTYQPTDAFRPAGAIALCVSPERRSTGGQEWSHKSMHGLFLVRSRTAAKARGFDDCLLVAADGRVLEATASNVFLWIDDILVTPPLDGSILPGITRASVLKLAKTMGFSVCERAVHQAELDMCSGIFLTNSVLGVQPVNRFEKRVLRVGNKTLRLRRALADQWAH